MHCHGVSVLGESAKEGIIEWQGPAVGITAGASQFAQRGVS